MPSSNRIRKYESGNQKRKKKQRIEELTRSQKGSMEKTDYEYLIEDFVSKKAKRISLFK